MSGAQRRPHTLTEEGKRLVAEKLINGIMAQCQFPAEDRDQIMGDLVKYSTSYFDGYKFGKELELQCGWSVNLGVCEILDEWSYHASAELKQMETLWVTEHDIQPKLPMGTRVSLPRGEAGIIDGIYEYGPAKYLVKVDGDKFAEKHNSRRIVNFEDAVAIVEATP